MCEWSSPQSFGMRTRLWEQDSSAFSPDINLAGCAEVQQCCDMLGGGGRDTLGHTNPFTEINLLFFPFFPPECRSDIFNQP